MSHTTQELQQALRACYDTNKQAKQSATVFELPPFRDLRRESEREDYRRTLYPLGCGKLFPVGWAGNSLMRCGAKLHGLGGQMSVELCHECKEQKGKA